MIRVKNSLLECIKVCVVTVQLCGDMHPLFSLLWGRVNGMSNIIHSQIQKLAELEDLQTKCDVPSDD